MTYWEFFNEFFVTVGVFATLYYAVVVLTYICIIIKLYLRKRKAQRSEKHSSE